MNWGKKLILVLGLFIAFIMGLGAIMIMRSENDALIDNDYYEKGQTYDNEYNARKGAVDDMVIPVITTDQYGVIITFPVHAAYKLICKRPSDSHMDKTFKGLTDVDCSIPILKGELEPGPWLLNIEFTINGKKYLFESEIVMP